MIRRIIAGVALAALFTGCVTAASPTVPGATPTPATGATATPANGATPTPATGATATPANGATPTPAAAVTPIPTEPGAGSPEPTVVTDPVLAAEFPTSIDGNPVNNLQTGQFLDVLAGISDTTRTDQFRAAMAAAGLDIDTLTFGNADVSINGNDESIQAIRTPGKDASVIVQNYDILATIGSEDPGPTLASATVAGRAVTTATDPVAETTDYLYVKGDTVFFIADPGPDLAATIIAALP